MLKGAVRRCSGGAVPDGARGVVAGAVSFEFAALGAEDGEARESPLLECELKCGEQNSQAIGHAAAEVDGGSLLEVLRGTRDFAGAEAKMNALSEHLVVENEIV